VETEATIRRVMRAALAEASRSPRISLTDVVLQALCRIASSVTLVSDVTVVTSNLEVSTSDIVVAVRAVAAELDADLEYEALEGRRIGRILGELRFQPWRTNKSRGWSIDVQLLAQHVRTHSIAGEEAQAVLHAAGNRHHGDTTLPS